MLQAWSPGQVHALPFRRRGGVLGGAWPSVPNEEAETGRAAPKLSSHALSGTAARSRSSASSSEDEESVVAGLTGFPSLKNCAGGPLLERAKKLETARLQD